MNQSLTVFEAERPGLISLCYRMLGEKARAEDAVQDTWLRLQRADHEAIVNPRAWLRRTAVRVALDELRSARRRREIYPGPWLPEPLVTSDGLGLEADFALAQDCELALLWAMERLGETERAAFILREAFDAGYDEIAATLNKSEAACRQLVSRAHRRLQESGPRFDADPAEVADLLQKFIAAAGSRNHAASLSLFSENAVAISDGGKKARAALRTLHGPGEIVTVLHAVMGQLVSPEVNWSLEAGMANHMPALIRRVAGKIDMVLTASPERSGKIAWLYVMRNPEKLPH